MAIGRIISIALLALTAVNPADTPTVAVSPKIGVAPIFVRVIATIPQNSHNRAFCLGAYLGDLRMQQACGDLEGDRADVTHEYRWQLREAGVYTILLHVQDDAGHVSRAATEIELQ